MSFRFGRFVFDCDTRQLLLDDQEVHLSPKAFDLLAILLRNRKRAVSKSELQELLWPSTFVEETNLAGLAVEIRRALRDSATRPMFLKTVYGFGYRFVGEIVESGAAPESTLTGPRPCLVFDHRRTVLLQGSSVIGRAPDATVQCNAAGVSRHHARIVLSEGRATLEDLGSKNGTYLHGTRVTSAGLSDGDEIRLGKATLIFRLEPELEPTDSVPNDPDEVY